MNVVCPNQKCGRFLMANFDGTGQFKCKNCKTLFTVTTPVPVLRQVLDNRRLVVHTG